MKGSPADERPRAVGAGGIARLAAWLRRLAWLALLVAAWTAVAMLSTAAIVHASGVRSWPFELVHHFVPMYLMGTAIVLLFALSVRRLVLTVAAGLLFGFFVWALVTPLKADLHPPRPLLEASSGPPTSALSPLPPASGAGAIGVQSPSASPSDDEKPQRPISIITNNVFCRNKNPDGLVRWIRSRPADVVVLQEVPRFLNRALTNLGAVYPYEARIPPIHSEELGTIGACQGIVVLSVYPIASSTVFQPIEDAWPAMIASLKVGDTTRVSLAIVHALDPIQPEGLQWRDQFLDRLATLLTSIHGPLIVLGDFNASPYTPALRAFQAEAGLVPSPWAPATYPSRLGTFGISIDHVFVRDAKLLRLEPLPAIGSDHRPLRASIALPVARPGVPPGFAGDAHRLGEPWRERTRVGRNTVAAPPQGQRQRITANSLWPSCCHKRAAQLPIEADEPGGIEDRAGNRRSTRPVG